MTIPIGVAFVDEPTQTSGAGIVTLSEGIDILENASLENEEWLIVTIPTWRRDHFFIGQSVRVNAGKYLGIGGSFKIERIQIDLDPPLFTQTLTLRG